METRITRQRSKVRPEPRNKKDESITLHQPLPGALLTKAVTEFHLSAIPEAPTCYPTLEEWQNPLDYIQQCHERYSDRFGLCKIVPPSGCSLTPVWHRKLSSFGTRIQKIHDLDARGRDRLHYTDGLLQFVEQTGRRAFKVPLFLYWSSAEATPETVPCDLYRVTWCIRIRGGFQVVKQTRAGYRQVLAELGHLPPKADESFNVQNYVRQLIQLCDGYLEPFEIYLNSANTFKTSLSAVEEKPDLRNVQTRKRNWTGEARNCIVCNKGSKSLLECERCNCLAHGGCLTPEHPETATTWFCPKCLCEQHDLGFDSGSRFTVQSYKQMADQLQSQIQKQYGPLMTEQQTELAYWRIVETPFDSHHESLQISYAADLRAHDFIDHQNSPPSPWRLDLLARHPHSLMHFIPQHISGMMQPWLYIGCLFSSFCWHVEDHQMPSLNHLHLGATKTWYGLPAKETLALERLVVEEAPSLTKTHQDWMHQLVAGLSPAVVHRHGLSVSKVMQRQGEMVLTFSNAYHSGFNQGFNVAEAVNVAPAAWCPFGEQVILRYKESKKLPVFSHESLILSVMSSPESTKQMKLMMRPQLEKLLEREKEQRNQFQHCSSVSESLHDCQQCRASLCLSYASCQYCHGIFCLSDGLNHRTECKGTLQLVECVSLSRLETLLERHL